MAIMSTARSRPLWQDDAPLRVGISACLLGAEVRYDGGHKRNEFLVEIFGRFVEFVPVCPEVEIGLGTPRETLRLEQANSAIRIVGGKSKLDRTPAMTSYASRRTSALAREELCGYVLKKDSPSCGMERVRVYGASGMATRNGVGLYAAALLNRFPNLPVEEEGRLTDAHLRENFVERVFAYHRLRAFFNTDWTIGALVKFHTAQKLVLMAHSVPAYRELGRLVADSKSLPRAQVRERYETAFMRALKKIATPSRHSNVLQHMLGYLRGHIDDAERAELVQLIEDYRAGWVPLVVPLTLLRHHVRRFAIEYLEGQIYLEPHPKELMLRNHV
jgi:uncharacterized protein YbgA (DUF1722 family)/uncharacterized protein YbbK (DUF523 family)